MRDQEENGTELSWTITKRIVAIPYRNFRTTYRSCLQGSRIQEEIL